MTAPPALELSRPFPLSRIGAGTRFVVEASEAECARLAQRMAIPGLHRFSCRFDLKRGENATIEASGLLQARLSQHCVVCLEPFEADLVEHFTLRFVPHGQENDCLDLEADDEVTYEGGVLELGEAASEQLALAIPPFPRKPGAELPAEAQDPAEGSFAALTKLIPRH